VLCAPLRRTAERIFAVASVLVFFPGLLLAQDEETELESAPLDLAETAGEWWARFQQPEVIAEMVTGMVNILAVVIISGTIYVVAMILFGRAVQRIEKDAVLAVPGERRRKQRVVTALELVRSVIRWVIIITSFVWILASAGMDIRPVLAGAGVLGLAVGFGAQNLVRDIVSGFFVLLEGQYAVGDYVRIGANFGMVESVGIRVTVLKDLDNQRHYVPNGSITLVTVYEEPFVNHIVEVPLADPGDCEKATAAVGAMIRRVQREYQRYLVYHEEPRAVMCDSAAIVRLPVAIFPTQDWLVNEEIPAAIRDALTQEEIAMREGRDVRVFMDLTRMPEYRTLNGEGEVA
jgi:moderate conductance mechanosensitive channel